MLRKVGVKPACCRVPGRSRRISFRQEWKSSKLRWTKWLAPAWDRFMTESEAPDEGEMPPSAPSTVSTCAQW